LVTHAALSFRGAAAALARVAAFTAGPAPLAACDTPPATPCATTIRSWVLRLGYARLTCPLPHDRRWAWLIDHTLQIGELKRFVILGVPLDQVPFGQRSLQLSDLYLIALVPMTVSNQERIDAELERAVARTGPPRQIVSDGASDLQKGIERFQTRHPGVTSVPDVAHYVANWLKHYWESDAQWTAFTRRLSETATALRQTRAAHLLAPKLRNKARFMSVGAVVRFGRIVLRQLQGPTPGEEVVTHYSWVKEFAAALAAWHEQHELVNATLRQVRGEGLFTRGVAELEEAWSRLPLSEHRVTVALRHRLRAYVRRYGDVLPVGERLVGSTEIVESAFGVQKRLSGDQAGSGLTVLSVGLGAVVGTTMTTDEMEAELARVAGEDGVELGEEAVWPHGAVAASAVVGARGGGKRDRTNFGMKSRN
jgi:hypothetical protein